MNRSSLSPRIVRGIALLAALLILTLSLTVFAPQEAEALPACGTHRKYYRDQTKTSQIGYSLHSCSGILLEHWGTTSPYITTNLYCCD